MARWDWYQTTAHGYGVDEIGGALLGAFDLADLAPGRPKNGYTQGAEIRRGESVLAEIWWGGNPGVHVKGTGEHAPAVAEAMAGFRHQPSRVDACEDWIERGLFDRLAEVLIGYATEHRIGINQQGDWVRGEARTLYLGSRASATRLVLYEKGYQAGGDPGWVRLEARVRPQKDARAAVAAWVPGEAFGASRWLCGALAAIGWDHLRLQSVGTVRGRSDRERQRAHLLHQYGRVLRDWADDVGGWDALARVLAGELSEGDTITGPTA